MKNIVRLLFALIVLLLCGCSSKQVDVTIDNFFLFNNKVVIDDTMQLKPLDIFDRYATIVLTKGKHSLLVNNHAKRTFTVSDKGGLLNYAGTEYVVFPLLFSNIKKEDEFGETIRWLWPIIIDSFLIIESGRDMDEKAIIQSLQSSIMRDMYVKDMRKYDSGQIFIEKAWDYGLGEEVPAQISVRVENKNDKLNEYKTKLTGAKAFLRYAMDSKAFTVIKLKDIETARRVVLTGNNNNSK